MIEMVEPRDHQPLDDHARRADDDGGEDERAPVGNARVLQKHPGGEGAHHVLGPMREVDHVHEAEDDGEPERQKGIEGAVDQAQEKLAEEGLRRNAQKLENHRRTGPVCRSSKVALPGA